MLALLSVLLSLCGASGDSHVAATPKTQNLIVVTLDGFRWQELFKGADETLIDKKVGGVPDVDLLRKSFWRDSAQQRRETLLPFIWGTIARQGQLFGDPSRQAPSKLTNGLKFSYPGYHELFCGFADDRIDANARRNNPNPSVFEFLHERPAFKGRVAACCTWDLFPFIFRTTASSFPVIAGWTPTLETPLSAEQQRLQSFIEFLPRQWPDNVYDVITMQLARDYLRRKQPRVLYLALGETDEWGHGRRYDLYLHSARNADRFLGELWTELQSMPQYAGKTSLLITTDHGRGLSGRDWTDHGKDTPGAEFIWIALLGPDTPALGIRENVTSTQSQVAATIAHLLGEDFATTNPKIAKPLPGVRSASPQR
jgi:hypothetical protein